MKRIFECFFIVICGSSFCNAQQAISTAGGETSGSGGSVSFTIGQTEYLTLTSNSGEVIQGVQQPYEIMVVTGIEPNKEITLECMAYPNPATDFLILKIKRDNFEHLSYQLMDMNGKTFEVKNIKNVETSISLQDYLPSIYFIKVMDNTKEIKTFKIIKSNQP